MQICHYYIKNMVFYLRNVSPNYNFMKNVSPTKKGWEPLLYCDVCLRSMTSGLLPKDRFREVRFHQWNFRSLPGQLPVNRWLGLEDPDPLLIPLRIVVGHQPMAQYVVVAPHVWLYNV
jgi:hypothetical protein